MSTYLNFMVGKLVPVDGRGYCEVIDWDPAEYLVVRSASGEHRVRMTQEMRDKAREEGQLRKPFSAAAQPHAAAVGRGDPNL